MTWHNPRISSDVASRSVACGRWSTLLAALYVLTAAACGSSSKSATIQITAPEKGQVLTSKDDADKAKSGLQYSVTASSTDVAPGTEVVLRIEGKDDGGVFATVGRDGNIEFANVTLPEGQHTLRVSTGNNGIQSEDGWDYTYKALVIESPKHGAALGFADDKDSSIPGVQINVSVKTYAIDMSDEVTLKVDTQNVGTPQTPNSSGVVTFSGITLENGDHTLTAMAGAAVSETVRVSVNPDCATATFVTPAPPPQDGQNLILGGGDKCPAEGEQFKTDFIVSTDAGAGRTVHLYVNGTLFSSETVVQTVATFRDVVLDRYNTTNKVEAVVEGAQGSNCPAIPYPAEIKLDCAGVDCSISAPNPVAGEDADGNAVQYLNASNKSGNGFDFEVHTDAQAVGHAVKLIIDGNESAAPSANPTGADPEVKATFAGVALSEGKHTIVARCQHDSGTTGSSRTVTWIVDTKACGVDIETPAADTLLVPGIDVDSKIGDVQIYLESKLTGDDCNRARAASCDPTKGIDSKFGYDTVDGKSPLKTVVTLSNEKSQHLCLDILDRAGNKSSDNVAVRYLPEMPKLLIETPADGTKFNAEGGTGYTKDSDTSSAAVCNADFDVACSQRGSSVKLHRGDAKGTVFATATCDAVASGDPALPSGFAGRARFKSAAFLATGNDTVTVVATENASGSSTVSESPAITVSGDCEAPKLTFTGDDPCAGGQIGVADMSSTVSKNVVVNDSSSDTQSATLTVTSGGNVSHMATANASNGNYTFNNASFGGPGTGTRSITLAVTAKDDFNNTGRVSCDAEIAFDLPVLMVSAPTDKLVFDLQASAMPAGWCMPTTGGANGVTVTATADVGTNRTASVSVNNGADIDLMLSGTTISGCVPLVTGANVVSVKLKSTRSNATAKVDRDVALILTKPDATSIITLAQPTAVDRGSRVNLTWAAPTQLYEGQFVKYELRCNNLPFAPGADTWWTSARVVPLPTDLKPPATSAAVDIRPGEDANCMMRAADAAGNLTPVATASTSVKVTFREQTINGVTAAGAAGLDLAGVGDVNGDGVDDLLVGGRGTAYLVFGSDTGLNATQPNVTFTSATPADSSFGEIVVGIGDFNGDARNDFAIAESFNRNFAQFDSGRVHVFFGRASGDAWPSTVALNAGSCGADVCFSATTGMSLGASLSSVGDFNGDSVADLAVGAGYYNSPTDDVPFGRVYVLLGGTGYTSGTRAQSFWGVNIGVEDTGADARRRGFVFTGDATYSYFGSSIASVGTFDSAAGADLVLAAIGNAFAMPVTNGGLFLLSGRAYTGPGLQALAVSDLGQPLQTFAPVEGHDAFVTAIGNVYDLPSANRKAVDVAVWGASETSFTIYLGDTNFQAADGITVAQAGGGNSYFGRSIGGSVDLDGDGLAELCASGRNNLKTGTPPGTTSLFYSDVLAARTVNRSVTTDASSALNPTVTGTFDGPDLAYTPLGTTVGMRVGKFVGDLNQDLKPDLAIGSPTLNGTVGAVTILY